MARSGNSNVNGAFRTLLVAGGLAMLMGISGCVTYEPEVAYTPPPPPAPHPIVAAPVTPPAPPPVTARTRTRRTTASWYGPGFNGREISTGERFDENDMTAASKTLPVGSHVVVRNPENGRSVTVRINDRVPRGCGHSLDLSRSAAQKLGITQKGVAKVEVKTTGHKTSSKTASRKTSPQGPEATQSRPASESNI
jgi:rare lipoprotein A